MTVDWKSLILSVVRWKQVANDNDRFGALPWHLPNVAASNHMVSKAEESLGVIFPTDYRQFLQHADGWPGFFISVDLFGTSDFLSARSGEVKQRAPISAFVERCGLLLQHVVPIGASEIEPDVFLLVGSQSSDMAGQVLWWANGEVQRFESFAAFFEAMVVYQTQIAGSLKTSN